MLLHTLGTAEDDNDPSACSHWQDNAAERGRTPARLPASPPAHCDNGKRPSRHIWQWHIHLATRWVKTALKALPWNWCLYSSVQTETLSHCRRQSVISVCVQLQCTVSILQYKDSVKGSSCSLLVRERICRVGKSGQNTRWTGTQRGIKKDREWKDINPPRVRGVTDSISAYSSGGGRQEPQNPRVLLLKHGKWKGRMSK